ncbi:hypothetical protein L208DRAFT_251863 [Tricholoma matsutake]|nr:hypothetical protein L208DRAFT_251863 [Tricholoma matsutake 945]
MDASLQTYCKVGFGFDFLLVRLLLGIEYNGCVCCSRYTVVIPQWMTCRSVWKHRFKSCLPSCRVIRESETLENISHSAL